MLTITAILLVLLTVHGELDADVFIKSYSQPNFYSYTLPDSTNIRPIIGILAQATAMKHAKYGDTYFYAAYVKFVEGGGARAAPIRVGEPDSYYTDLLDRLNGVIIPGGDVDPLTSPYAKATNIIVRYAMKARDKGDYFPVLGICLGFETLAVLLVGKNILTAVDADDYVIPLEFANGYAHSRLFGQLTPQLHRILKSQNVTANAHHWALTPKTYDESTELQQYFHILATNKDREGVEFISAMEAYDYPIYAVQFHPEKNTYIWSQKYPWLHTYDAITVTQYFASFFINQSRNNSHHFPDLQSEYDACIGRFTPISLPIDDYPFEQLYVFNLTKRV